MEPFFVGLGCGALIGLAATFLILRWRGEAEDPPSWAELLARQQATPPAPPSRLSRHEITWEV